MRLGYSTNAFVKYTVFESVREISGLGFGGIEILCDRPHLYPPDFQDAELRRLQELLRKEGLKVTNLNSFTLTAIGDTYLPSWIEPEEERRAMRIQHTLQCLTLAKFFGGSNISVPPGGPLLRISRREATVLFTRGLEKVLPAAESLGVKLLIEPEPNLLMENSRQFREFVRDLRSPAIGLNFDIGHFYCVGEDPAAAFQDLFAWIGHIHLEDIAESRIHNHLIPGKGAVNFREFFRVIKETAYPGDFSLELYPYVDRPVEAGREGLRHLLPLMEEAGLCLEGVKPR